jgi:MipA family protein
LIVLFTPTIKSLAPRALLIAALASTALAAPAFAETEDGNWSGFITAGPGVAPEFAGSGTLRVIPFIAADIKYKKVTLEARGLGARLDVLSGLGSGAIYGGPLVNFKTSRDNKSGKVGDPVRFLNKIDFETQGGAFIGVKLGGDENGRGQIRIETALAGGANGFEATGVVSYALVRTEKVFFDINSSVAYANKESNETYFGVTAAEALRSGLAAYTPGAGIRDIGSGVTLGYQFNKRWSLVANANYNYLVGDAAKSPIVKGRLAGPVANRAEGSRSQFVGGIGIGWSF